MENLNYFSVFTLESINRCEGNLSINRIYSDMSTTPSSDAANFVSIYQSHANFSQPGVFSLDRVAIHKQAGYGRPFRKGMDDWRHYPTRFTVARDPFSRVLSSYLDKAYLPDFWMPQVLNIVQRLKLVNETFEEDFMR